MTTWDAVLLAAAVLLIAVPAVVFLLPAWWRAQDRKALLQLAATALEQDKPLSVEILSALPGARTEPDGARDLRKGAFLIAVGGGIILIALCVGGISATFDPKAGLAMGCFIGAFGVLPASIGVAFVVLGRMQQRAETV